MPGKLSAATFLKAVRQSGLVGDDQLQALERESTQSPPVRDAEAWASKLVEQELLTEWQAGKLLQGKHRGFILGNYRLLALLGKGGMSSVYLAEHRLMRRRCAIKVLPTKHVNSASYLGRFHREAQAVASLDHPNIVRAYDVSHQKEDDAEIHFLVMEYVAGQSLYELVASCGPLAVEDAADFLRQAADGLEHAHRAGIIHRDVKPGNLLVDGSGTVKILDLGLARFFHESFDDRLTLDHDERILGTADFLAPEQALDSHTADHRADVYSLGCTGYFLLTGHAPFTEGTLTQRLLAHQNKTPPPLQGERPDLPESIVEIIERMMAKRPADRYQTAGEVAEVLANWLSEHASAEWKARYREPRAAAAGATEEPSSFLQRRKVGNSQPTLVLSNSDTDPAPEPFASLEFDDESTKIVVDDAPGSGSGSGSTTPLPRRASRAPRRRRTAMLATTGAVIAGLALVIAWWNRGGEPDPVPRVGQGSGFEIAEGGQRGTGGSAAASGTLAPLKWRIAVEAEGEFPTLDSALAYIREHRERFETEGARGRRIRVEVAPGSKVRQAIVVDNSSERNYPNGLQIVCPQGPAAALEPVGTAPAVLVANISDFLLEGFHIRGDRVETAVHLKGDLSGCRFQKLVVEGFTQNGFRCEAVSGVLRSELLLQEIVSRSESGGVNAFAFDGGDSGTARVRIQRCRMTGNGGTGLRLSGNASYVSVLQNIFSGYEEGIRFEGDTITLRHIVVGNNTFHRLEGGIVVSSLPSGSSSELGFYRNLFADVTGPELRIARDYDLNAFVRMLSTIGRGIRRNWSDRALADGLKDGEHDLVIPPDGARVNGIDFVSSDPADADYLKPASASRFVIADSPETSEELRPFIGAVAP